MFIEDWNSVTSFSTATSSKDTPFRLAIIGCGAISEIGHIPGALASRNARLTTLIDLDLARAEAMGEKFGIDDCRNSIDGLDDSVDGVVAALPHNAHQPVGVDLLDKGLHVLMEKPLGCTVKECEALGVAAKQNNRVLAVALMRRFVAANRLAKRLIDQQLFGKPLSFEINDARVFSWPIKTPFLVNPDYPGRGVLIGNGSHFFDLVLWWFGKVAEVSCQADTKNGGETDAIVELKMDSGVEGVMRLSRVRAIKDMVRIQFENATLTLPPFGSDVRLFDRDGQPLMGLLPELMDPKGTNSARIEDLMSLQIDDFVGATRGAGGPEVGPEMATEAIALVERCAATIELSKHPWVQRTCLPDGMVLLG